MVRYAESVSRLVYAKWMPTWDVSDMLEITGEKSAAVRMFTDLSNEIPAENPDVEKIVAVMGRNGATVRL